MTTKYYEEDNNGFYEYYAVIDRQRYQYWDFPGRKGIWVEISFNPKYMCRSISKLELVIRGIPVLRV